MIVFGYIVYVLLTLWVTLGMIVVIINPFGSVGNRGESLFMVCIAAILWYGAYTWWPFKISLV